MDIIDSKMCDIQGRLFELAFDKGFNIEDFIKEFMRSKLASFLDSSYNRLQWVGEEYLLEEIIDECGSKIRKEKSPLFKETVYWIGYIYRYWHYYKNIESKKIYHLAPIETMKANYFMFHSFTPELAIDELIEIYKQKKRKHH